MVIGTVQGAITTLFDAPAFIVTLEATSLSEPAFCGFSRGTLSFRWPARRSKALQEAICPTGSATCSWQRACWNSRLCARVIITPGGAKALLQTCGRHARSAAVCAAVALSVIVTVVFDANRGVDYGGDGPQG